MSILKSGAGYFVLYLLLLVPTYALPYLGSNSSVLGSLGVVSGVGILPHTWMHMGCLLALVLLAWLRGSLGGKAYIAVFPALAALADMVPGFSLIPFLPSMIHVIGIVLGVRSDPIASLSNADDLAVAAGARSRLKIAAGTLACYTVVAVAASMHTVESLNTSVQALNHPQVSTAARLALNPGPSTNQTRPAIAQMSPQTMGTTTQAIPLGTVATDPAIALGTAKVDPLGTAIMTGGFVGLRVGHTEADATRFFGRAITPVDGCGDLTWRIHQPEGTSGLHFFTDNGRIVAFHVSDKTYSTRSGLQVGNPESRIVELFGDDPTLERAVRTLESSMTRLIEYRLGKGSPTGMRIFVEKGVVTDIIFGSAREIGNVAEPC